MNCTVFLSLLFQAIPAIKANFINSLQGLGGGKGGGGGGYGAPPPPSSYGAPAPAPAPNYNAPAPQQPPSYSGSRPATNNVINTVTQPQVDTSILALSLPSYQYHCNQLALSLPRQLN